MVDLGTVVEIGVLVLLPKLAGLLAPRLVRHASWTAWPATTIAVFGAVFYWWCWVPARRAIEQAPAAGLWTIGLGLGFELALGLLAHLGLGILCGVLARRLRRRRAS